MPATIDTPLYENARSKEGVLPRPAPPIYPASEVAKAIEQTAVSPKRDVFAGPAGVGFSVGNTFMPALMDKMLAKVGRPAILTNQPKATRGEDNLDTPMRDVPPTSGGGWRGRRYKSADLATRVGLGLVGFMLLRKLFGR